MSNVFDLYTTEIQEFHDVPADECRILPFVLRDSNAKLLDEIFYLDQESVLRWRIACGKNKPGDVAGRVRVNKAGSKKGPRRTITGRVVQCYRKKDYVRTTVGIPAKYARLIGRASISVGEAVYVLHTGFYPPEGFTVDHIDENATNNKLNNLRLKTTAKNSVRKNRPDIPLSKYDGVAWHSRYGKWLAKVTLDGVSFSIGYFEKDTDAHWEILAAKKTFEKTGEYPGAEKRRLRAERRAAKQRITMQHEGIAA